MTRAYPARTGLPLPRRASNPSLPPLRACKAVTVDQPWASMIASGLKRILVLRYPTQYRGPLAICASRISSEPGLEQVVASLEAQDGDNVPGRMLLYYARFAVESGVYPLGAVVASCDLVACEQVTAEMIPEEDPLQRALDEWRVGRYAWRLENSASIEPYPMRSGGPELWDCEVPL